MFTVYQVTNKSNGNSYVGQTTRAKEERWKEHQRQSIQGSKTHFHCAIRKYGADNFLLETLEEGWDPEIGKNIREPYWISVLKPEYNLTKGGEGTIGYKCTAEQNELNSKLRMGNTNLKGHKHIEKFKQLKREQSTGNQNAKGAKRSVAFKKDVGDRLRGIPHTPKQNHQQSIRQQGKKRGPYKKVKS